MTLILGIDPANITGWALSNNTRGVWRLDSGDARLGDLRSRVHSLQGEEGNRVGVIAHEDASFGSRNPSVQAGHNELVGIIKLAAIEIGATTIAFHPTTIKKFATNYGHATKEQMVRACKIVLGLVITDDNEADAIWIMELGKWRMAHPAAIPAKRKQAARPRRAKVWKLF